MKIKLLTICLLLFTSQVFAKELQIYDCAILGDTKKSKRNAEECNSNCKKIKLKVISKVNENTNKVLIEYLDSEDGRLVSQTILQSEPLEETYGHYTEDTLEIFDSNNWVYASKSGWVGKGYPNESIRKIYMRNGKYHNTYKLPDEEPEPGLAPRNYCGK